MFNKKSAVALFLVSAMLLSLLAGCTGKTETTASTETTAATSESTEATSEKTGISFTDHAGRTVTLDEPAEKVVSVYYLSTSLLAAIGAEDKIVGIEMKADTRALYKEAFPEIWSFPQ